MRSYFCVVIGGMVGLAAACSHSAEEVPGGPARAAAVAPFLEDVENRIVTSSITGRSYAISIALPLGYADSVGSYPVLYALDANGQFGTVSETARMLRYTGEVPELIIVGIGYPYGGRYEHARSHRIFDFFSTLDHEFIEAVRPHWPPMPRYDAGGAAEFLKFIQEELIPSIEADYRIDTDDRGIYGHSAGGWFSLFALLESEGGFARAIVGSPALWWDDEQMFRVEEAYAARHSSLHARVFLSVGSDEPDELAEPFAGTSCLCMTRNVDRLTRLWESRNYSGLEWAHHVFEGENHDSVIPATISRSLRYIYGSG